MDATADFDLDIDRIVRHHDAQLSDVRLHYVEAGKPNDPLVLCLHGFPEFWYSWRHQISALSQAGYRVVVPDQRGYAQSDKPSGVANYEIRKLVGDIVELLDHLGADSARIVAHDWGAIVAWFLAMMHPERVQRLAILNVPHPLTMWRGMRTLRQLRKSWYVGFFQLPWLPEAGIKAFDYRAIRKLLREDPVNPDCFDAEDIERYVRTIDHENALPTMLNWYRASARDDWKSLYAPIDIETLVIWGTQDLALGEELAEPPPEFVPNCRVEKLHASHWVQCDAPERVNALLLHYLAES